MTDAAAMDRALRRGLEPFVQRGELPGLVALVADGGPSDEGEVSLHSIGTTAFGSATAMGSDTLFRIASLSKPIVAVAALTMVQDGTIALHDPVARWLPELSEPVVLRHEHGPLHDTVPARRDITVRDLLTCGLGTGCVLAPPGTYPIQQAEEALELRTFGPPWPPPPFGSEEWLRRLASLPLLHQPGEGWRYNTGIEVLGVLLERVGAAPLETVLRRRVCTPLGMVDTAFSVPDSERHRFTVAYVPDPDGTAPGVLDDCESSMWGAPPAMANAAGWLVSTLADLWSFVRMVRGLGRGRLGGGGDGPSLLSEELVAMMLSDQLTAAQRADAAAFVEPGASWGFGLQVPAGNAGGRCGYGWDGGTGTTWRTLPDGRTGILLTQLAMTSPQPPAIFDAFWAAIGGAGADRAPDPA